MKRSPLQALFSSPLGVLLACVLLLGRLCGAQTPPTPQPTAFWRKVETSSQMAKRRIVDLVPSSALKVRDVLQVPRKREIDIDASLAYRTTGQGADSGLMPFWIGHLDLNASGYTVQFDQNGTQQPLFDPQKYIWSADRSPIVPLAPPYASSRNPFFEFGYIASRIVSSLAIDLGVGEVPSWTADLLTAAWDDNGQNYAADGNPLEILKPGPSTPRKHFYWNLGELRDSTFPQTVTTIVKVTGEGEGDGIHPAQVKVNFQLPTRTVFDVEIELFNWVDNTEAPLANVEEFKNKLLLDDEFQNTVVKDVVLKVVEVAVDYATGKVVARVIVAIKAPAKKIAQRLNEAVHKALHKPAKALADGTIPPPPAWYSTHGTRVKATDRAKYRRADHVSPPTSVEPGTGETPPEEPLPEEPPAEDKQEEGEDEQPIASHPLYLYTAEPNLANSYWTNPNEALRPDNPWPRGYYLTNLPPNEVHRAVDQQGFFLRSGQHASALREGQLPFALFGHPYVFGSSPVHWRKINMGDIGDGNGTIVSPRLRPSFNNPLLPRGSSDTSVPYRFWGYGVFCIDSPGIMQSLFDQRRNMGEGTVSSQPGTPGEMDVPTGNLFPVSKGVWVDPNNRANGIWHSTDPNVIAVDEQLNGRRREVVPVQFRNGYPDFSLWAQAYVDLSHQTTNEDFYTFTVDNRPYGHDNYHSDRLFALMQNPPWMRNGQPDYWRVRIDLRRDHAPRNTWHHHQDMRRMQLVPQAINSIPHDGGATWAKKARW